MAELLRAQRLIDSAAASHRSNPRYHQKRASTAVSKKYEGPHNGDGNYQVKVSARLFTEALPRYYSCFAAPRVFRHIARLHVVIAVDLNKVSRTISLA